jgi:hypothetical protein
MKQLKNKNSKLSSDKKLKNQYKRYQKLISARIVKIQKRLDELKKREKTIKNKSLGKKLKNSLSLNKIQLNEYKKHSKSKKSSTKRKSKKRSKKSSTKRKSKKSSTKRKSKKSSTKRKSKKRSSTKKRNSKKKSSTKRNSKKKSSTRKTSSSYKRYNGLTRTEYSKKWKCNNYGTKAYKKLSPSQKAKRENKCKRLR